MGRHGALRRVIGVAVTSVAIVAAGCSGAASSTAPSSSSTRPTTTMSTTTLPPTTTTTVPGVTGAVRVSIVGLPADLRRATIAYTFDVVLSNPSSSLVSGLAPVFQVVAPPCNCIQGTLERLDPSTGVWAPTSMPEGDGYDPASVATGPVDVPARGSTTVALRLRVAMTTAPKMATAQAFAVDVASHTQVGDTTTQTVRILP